MGLGDADEADAQCGHRGVLLGEGREVEGNGVRLGGECIEAVLLAPEREAAEAAGVGALGCRGLGTADVLLSVLA